MKKITTKTKTTMFPERDVILNAIIAGDVVGLRGVLGLLSPGRLELVINQPLSDKYLVVFQQNHELTGKAGEIVTKLYKNSKRGLNYAEATLQVSDLLGLAVAQKLFETFLAFRIDFRMTYSVPSLFQMAAGASTDIFGLFLECLQVSALERGENAQELIDMLTQQLDETGRTALHHAAIAGHAQIVGFLLSCSHEALGRRDAHEKTALDYAVENGHQAAVALLTHGAFAEQQVAQKVREENGAMPYLRPKAIKPQVGDAAVVRAGVKINGLMTPAYHASLLKRVQDKECIKGRKSAFKLLKQKV